MQAKKEMLKTHIILKSADLLTVSHAGAQVESSTVEYIHVRSLAPPAST